MKTFEEFEKEVNEELIIFKLSALASRMRHNNISKKDAKKLYNEIVGE